MKKTLLLSSLLFCCSVACFSQTTQQTCVDHKWLLLWANPITHHGITIWCDKTWAVAIEGTHKAWQKKKELAAGYLPDHAFAGYVPVKAHTQQHVYFEAKDGSAQYLIVTYGAVGEDSDGTEWAWIKMDGIEQ